MKITQAQKDQFLKMTGLEYPGKDEGILKTQSPYGDTEYNLSPYYVIYRYIPEEGLLCIEMGHRMTNSDASVFDPDGEYVQDSKYVESSFADSFLTFSHEIE